MMLSNRAFLVALPLLSGVATVDSFVVQPLARPSSSRPLLTQLHAGPAVTNSDQLFASDGWKPIRTDLDKCPVFCCANSNGHPLAYSIEMKKELFTVPFFYCDSDDAQRELKSAQESMKDNEVKLIPFPLGKAFEMWAKDEAVIVPSKEAILQAGAPPNANPIGQQVPLFACMDIMQQSEEQDGGGVLPLFMALEEANAAVAEAVQVDGGNADDFEVISLSLQRAVELLATAPETTPAFQFMAPMKSIKFIHEELS